MGRAGCSVLPGLHRDGQGDLVDAVAAAIAASVGQDVQLQGRIGRMGREVCVGGGRNFCQSFPEEAPKKGYSIFGPHPFLSPYALQSATASSPRCWQLLWLQGQDDCDVVV